MSQLEPDIEHDGDYDVYLTTNKYAARITELEVQLAKAAQLIKNLRNALLSIEKDARQMREESHNNDV